MIQSDNNMYLYLSGTVNIIFVYVVVICVLIPQDQKLKDQVKFVKQQNFQYISKKKKVSVHF